MIDIASMIVLGRVLLDSKAVNGGVTTDPWDVLTKYGANDVTYTVDVDPETIAAYRRREEQLKLLRG